VRVAAPDFLDMPAGIERVRDTLRVPAMLVQGRCLVADAGLGIGKRGEVEPPVPRHFQFAERLLAGIQRCQQRRPAPHHCTRVQDEVFDRHEARRESGGGEHLARLQRAGLDAAVIVLVARPLRLAVAQDRATIAEGEGHVGIIREQGGECREEGRRGEVIGFRDPHEIALRKFGGAPPLREHRA
jgi:hypothetical protein